jgi:hypothetical protein
LFESGNTTNFPGIRIADNLVPRAFLVVARELRKTLK